LELAEKEDLVLRIERRPGQYVVAGEPLVQGWPPERATPELCERLARAFVVGSQRTHAQDVEHSVNQLVEIAVRALSPGINDPFTAIACVDRIGSSLCRLAQRRIPSPLRRGAGGAVRVVAPSTAFSDVADAALNQIRQHARTSAAVTIRLLESIAVVATVTTRPEDRGALRMHAELIVRGAREALPEKEDLRAVESRYLAAQRSLGETGH
jgi:uncharacterized membrane protein